MDLPGRRLGDAILVRNRAPQLGIQNHLEKILEWHEPTTKWMKMSDRKS